MLLILFFDIFLLLFSRFLSYYASKTNKNDLNTFNINNLSSNSLFLFFIELTLNFENKTNKFKI